MPKIHRADGLTPQNTVSQPPIQPPAETIPTAAPEPKPAKPAVPLIGEPTGFYDQDNDASFENRKTAKNSKKGGRGSSQKSRTKNSGDLLYRLGLGLCAVIFVVSGGLLVKRFMDDRRVEGEFAELASKIDTTAAQAAPETEETPQNAAKFAALQAENPDFFGWISIAGTNLDFPVMYAPGNKDFYLRHDFNGQYSIYGVPYLDEKTVVNAVAIESKNLIIYGHNMKTGTIFGCLTGYKNADYYARYPRIEFDTLYGDAVYEVFAAFAIDVVKDQSFVYNTYVNMEGESYDRFVAEVKSRSDVDTGITPTNGEQILTLSTCEYSSDNGRYVVVARRVQE